MCKYAQNQPISKLNDHSGWYLKVLLKVETGNQNQYAETESIKFKRFPMLNMDCYGYNT